MVSASLPALLKAESADTRAIDPITGLPGNGYHNIHQSPFGTTGVFWYTRGGAILNDQRHRP
jgi:hypothetical protein